MVDYNGLENRRTERYRGFESLSLRSRVLQIERFAGLFYYSAFRASIEIKIWGQSENSVVSNKPMHTVLLI